MSFKKKVKTKNKLLNVLSSFIRNLEIEYLSFSDQGGRPENQDNCDEIVNEIEGVYCFVVADGVGGQYGGKMASKLAVDAILEYFTSIEFDEEQMEEYIETALIEAEEEINEKKQSDPVYKTMRTTCAILVILDNKAFYATLGDTRIYIFRNKKIKVKTKDHSVAQLLVDKGYLKDEDLRTHADKNRLTKSLGMENDVEPYINSKGIRLQSNDYILICTDGLWENFSDKELNVFFKKNHDLTLQGRLDALFEEAKKRASSNKENYDNLTAQIIHVK